MDPDKLFRTELFLLRLYGFKFDYQNDWKDFLMKLLAVFAYFCNLVQIVFYVYNFTIGKPTLEVFSESFSSFVVTLESVVKLTVFYWWSPKLKDLLERLHSVLSSGQSFDEEKLNKTARSGRQLLVCFLSSASMTSSGFVFMALYRNVFDSQRVLPFKGT